MRLSMTRSQATIDQVQPEDWDKAIEPLSVRTVFHSRAWLESVCAAYGYRLVLACARTHGNVVAAWPAIETRKGPFRILGSPLPGTSTPYLGPLFSRDADVPAILTAFMKDRTLGRYSYFACRTQDEHRTVDLSDRGFTDLLRFETYLVDLTLSEEDRWAGMKSECRNRIRKATKSGVEVRLENSPEFIEEFWHMAVAVFERQNRAPTYTRRFVQAIWEALARGNHICALTAWLDNQRIATLVLPHDEHTMYYWAGASRAAFRRESPNNLLLWEAICEARRRGLKVFDFVSIYGGPGKFKRSFGGTETATATHWERSRSKLTGWMKSAYERHLRSRHRARHG
ncbi:MAG: lipid II:glycine glycyltransferase FemX [Phycisphaerae bacterium]